MLRWEVKVAPVRHEHALTILRNVGLDNAYMHFIGYLVERSYVLMAGISFVVGEAVN